MAPTIVATEAGKIGVVTKGNLLELEANLTEDFDSEEVEDEIEF